MSPLVSLRWSRGLLALPVMVVGAVAVAYAAKPAMQDDYPVSRIAVAYRCLILLSPLLAVWAAWRSHALRAFLEAREPVRRRPTALLRALWSLPLAAMLAQFTALALVAGVAPWDSRALAMSGTALSALLASFVLGAAAGQVLPRAVAISATGVVLFLWHAVPAGVSPYWLRYANASFVTCCTPEQQVSELVYRASIGVAAVWALGILALLALRLAGRPLLVACGAVMAAGLVVGHLLVGPHPDALAVQARAERPACAVGEITVCVWPEHAHRLPAELALFKAVREDLEAAGVHMPDDYSESPLYPSGALRIEAASYASDADRRFTVATALLPDPQYCAVGGADSAQVHTAFNDALHWLSRKAGMSDDEVESRLGPPGPGLVSVLTMKPDRQHAWYLEQQRLLAARCAMTGGSDR